MDNFIKGIIEESFASKKQQKYFYAKANDQTLSPKERKKWKKMADEFANKTNFKKLPEKVSEEDLDEIVDEDGNIISSKIPVNFNTKGVTSNFTTDDEVGIAHGMMGNFGIGGPINTSRVLKYWAESDMSKALASDELLIDPEMDYEKAIDHLQNDLGLNDDEAKERAEKMGFDEDLPDGKIRLIEKPKEYVEEYIDNIIKNKTKPNELVKKNQEIDETKINPIVIKQLNSLKQTLKKNDIDVSDIIDYLKNE